MMVQELLVTRATVQSWGSAMPYGAASPSLIAMFTTLPLNPGEEPLDDPASFVAAQPSTVRGLVADAIGTVRRDHLRALFAQCRVEFVTVIRAVADQILRLRFDHVEVEGQM
jgi:hypothetical protein